ncbi:MAG TPA: DUF2062 domain-containing protein [Elusimicrobia bacterium]|nr:MAG: hypothetical protein A2016_12935 [Elusimicrobia bacterium GWF2_62_30]HBA61378.1 DUF2062 domain-containing protein [Elusimicrobiota bacterium]
MGRTCVIIPAYNNGRTAAAVIRGALAYLPDVIFVDDGSTDGTQRAAAGLPGVTVLRHDKNRGKGAALLSGFAKALALGFDRAITMDSDGQHLPEDIPAFLGAAAREPEALFVGSRKRVGARVSFGSRFANKFSDFWFWLESGASLPDTQCGFRSYPLAAIDRLKLDKRRYDLEVEVLVKAAWLGVPLRAVPVTAVYLPAGERVSHFRPFVDFMRISHLYTLFFFMRFFLPAPLQRVSCDRSLEGVSFLKKLRVVTRSTLTEAVSAPLNTSLSIGFGMMLGILPIWGFQMLTASLVAARLRLNSFIAVAASNISFPAIAPFIFYFALVLGHALLTGAVDFSPAFDGGLRQLAAERLPEWLLGSVVLGVAAGLAGGLLSYAALSLVRAVLRYRDA